ncbi:MAG: LacI family DNA-binding transcriptional regulator [Chloroflexota bacterium]
MSHAKIEDVARQAGVSTATVSRVLSGKTNVSDGTRQRVLGVARQLDYRPSRVAQSLRSQKSHIIGVLLSDIQNPFFTSMVRAIEDVAYNHGYSLMLCNTDEDPEKEALYIDLMLSQNVAGVILSPSVATEETTCSAYSLLIDAKMPVVIVDRRLPNEEVDTVVVDSMNASYKMISHLIEQGHQRIGCVVGPTNVSTGKERRDGYLKALKDHKIPMDNALLRSGVAKVEPGYYMTSELLSLDNPLTALFTGNNLLTIGALRAIHERGLIMPTDIALAAFDEMDWMFVMNPPLSVVAQPTYMMGSAAADLLLARIAYPDRAVSIIALQPKIHFRGSSVSP